MFQAIYDVLQTYIYGSIELTSYMDLTLTIMATLLCVVVALLPFIVLFSICKMVLR